ncbi:MAG: metallophosphoesterase family protein [Syntrophobacteraceae bacterium]
MKIVVMSDTHLSRVTDEFRCLCSEFCDNADMVIHLGDWERVEMLNYLEQYRLEAVSGNMDDHAVQDRLPAIKVIRVGNFRLGLTHGWGSPNGIRQRIRKEFTGVDTILFGHTHQPLMVREDGLLWFNPGSVYLGRGGSRRSIGILRIQETIEAEIVDI